MSLLKILKNNKCLTAILLLIIFGLSSCIYSKTVAYHIWAKKTKKDKDYDITAYLYKDRRTIYIPPTILLHKDYGNYDLSITFYGLNKDYNYVEIENLNLIQEKDTIFRLDNDTVNFEYDEINKITMSSFSSGKNIEIDYLKADTLI